MEVCGTEFRTDSSAQGKCWHSSNTFCKCSYLPPVPLDANSLPPHLRGMLCTCRLLTPPQAELHHGAADREQHATSRHRQQSKRRTSGSYGAQTGQGVWLSHLLEQADGKNCPLYKKIPFKRYTRSYSMLYGEGKSSISYCWCLCRVGFVAGFKHCCFSQVSSQTIQFALRLRSVPRWFESLYPFASQLLLEESLVIGIFYPCLFSK